MDSVPAGGAVARAAGNDAGLHALSRRGDAFEHHLLFAAAVVRTDRVDLRRGRRRADGLRLDCALAPATDVAVRQRARSAR